MAERLPYLATESLSGGGRRGGKHGEKAGGEGLDIADERSKRAGWISQQAQEAGD